MENKKQENNKLVTNAQIRDYYLTKRNNCLATKCYDIFTPSKYDGYELMFTEFLNPFEFSKQDDLSFYKVLSAWRSKLPVRIYDKNGKYFDFSLDYDFRLENLDFLNDVEDLNIFHPSKNEGQEKNQKWHLYVAVLAYQAVCGYKQSLDEPWMWNNLDAYWNLPFPKPMPQFSSPVLQTWLVDNAESKHGGKNTQNLRCAFQEYKNGTIDKVSLKNSIKNEWKALSTTWNMPHD